MTEQNYRRNNPVGLAELLASTALMAVAGFAVWAQFANMLTQAETKIQSTRTREHSRYCILDTNHDNKVDQCEYYGQFLPSDWHFLIRCNPSITVRDLTDKCN